MAHGCRQSTRVITSNYVTQASRLIFQIAPLQLSERVQWEHLWTEYQRFYRVALPAAVTENTWQRLHNGRVYGLGARDAADELQGIVHFLFHEDTWSTAPACYLQDLYVEPKARGCGCARRLIEAVAQAAKAASANEPYWLTHETNDTARQLYDRLAKNQGFIQYVYSSGVTG
jgi:GNAT superfamily N-acetyltransferase